MSEKMAIPKYARSAPIELPDRQWPSRTIEKSPVWCSVDLRDGNQALPNPMNPNHKLEYFRMLCDIGFKHLEVGFPSASQDDFGFTRMLIENGHIPDDVFIMGLTQCRPHLIERTFEALRGAKQAILHAYCATSDLHMRHVFGLSREETIKMVVNSVKQIGELTDSMPDTDVRLQFSPEEYTDSDMRFVMELCQAVFETWDRATVDKPLIFNLPATVERRPPNQHADMIEWFRRNFPARDRIMISIHTHNDQGMAVAAAEMGLLAGGDRVEGALFGHGERTGNADLVTLANNLHSRGINTGLDFSNMTEIVEIVERLTGMPVYYRQPYAGEYVFTAFSGSHQDAIRKGMEKREEAAKHFGVRWKVPYLHIDPSDLGRRYEGLIRINAQSGKGGVAWVLEQEYGLKLPRAMHQQLGEAVKKYSEQVRREVTGEEVYRVFEDQFLAPKGPYELAGYWPRPDDDDPTHIHGEIRMRINGEEKSVSAEGNGPISAFVHGMQKLGATRFAIDDYAEQAVGKGEDARAVAYVPLKLDSGKIVFGVGSDTNIDQAAVRAIVAGLNRIEGENGE